MLLSWIFEDAFSPLVRRRGDGYVERGAVRVEESSPDHVLATVTGSEAYTVELRCEGRRLVALCSCPYAETAVDPCKHVWAVMLTAEPLRALTNLAPGRNPTITLRRNGRASTGARSKPEALPAWKRQLTQVQQKMSGTDAAPSDWPASREVLYLLNGEAMHMAGSEGITIEVLTRDRKMNGSLGRPKPIRLTPGLIPRLPSPEDREILSLLLGAHPPAAVGYFRQYGQTTIPHDYTLGELSARLLLPRVCATGRCYLRRQLIDDEPESWPVLQWDEGSPWQLRLQVTRLDGHYHVSGDLHRDAERLPLDQLELWSVHGIFCVGTRMARFDHFGAHGWIPLLRKHGTLRVPEAQADEFLVELLEMPRQAPIEFPPELQFESVRVEPRPTLRIHPPVEDGWRRPMLGGDLAFDYGTVSIDEMATGNGKYQRDGRQWVERNRASEQRAVERLREAGFRMAEFHRRDEARWELLPARLNKTVAQLVAEGWRVEADGKLYRGHGAIQVKVSSNVDWFDLSGTVQFGGATASLPELLRAIRRGDSTVPLGDGTYGLLPEEWLEKYGALASLGKTEDEVLRFQKNQIGVLDALLASQPEAEVDEVFAHARDQLMQFSGITACDPPAGFRGTLRGYQREGLGWMQFLADFGFGGCLADDMGLGKTVMVLALLEARRELRIRLSGASRPGPSLVVVPRSLVFNWKAESLRFTPYLHLLDHTGTGRAPLPKDFDEIDLIITTYGTLRRDAAQFKDVVFDYVILDEAQSIKNADTESSKAARLLRADHRLALSGTPIENHLGELWSLVEFLNPGMLGSASVFRMTANTARNPDPEVRTMLARALRPFILRRTKEQVAKDLPPKLEQTIFCDMGMKQRKLYDELRAHYRQSLLGKIQKEGIARSKIQILEALLRLRQAACHPGLLDESRRHDESAKLELLMEQLGDVLEEGHKTLVFSQFTSFLALLRDRLDDAKIPYEYLDGRTRDREARVDRFQNDPEAKLFLISLKAGGLGLNLTAAEYVFLLDPWWNPAVEAQAIDRAHRIGQTKPVFAYRLIARDTVEEKILALQQTKRDLADAVITADNSLIRDLGRDELELLLS